MSNAKSKSIKNIFFGIMGQIITLLFGLIVPRLIILNYGSEANGLIASISQIFIYVSLLEAGIGGATLQALYRPIGKNDFKSSNAILSATNIYYKKVGYIYGLIVLLLAFLYPLFIKSQFDFQTVFFVIFFNGMCGAINFFFQGKYHILLQAEGKNYIKTNLGTIIYIFSSLIKILLIHLGFGIVALQVSFFVLTLFQMIYILVYIKKYYKWINLKVKPDYKSLSQKNSVLVHNISSLIFGNTDTIILTLFCNLKVVSVYALISTLITYVNTLINNFSTGITFVLGQNFYNNRDNFNKYYSIFETFYYCLICYSVTLIYIFLNPFLTVYTKGMNDINYVDKYLCLLFCLNFYLSCARVPSIYVVYNCAGEYKQTQKQSIIESSINIITSFIFVKILGIYGVLLGTIIALLYRTNDLIIYSAKNVLYCSIWKNYKKLFYNSILLFVFCFINHFNVIQTTNYFSWFLYLIIYGIIIGFSFIILNYFIDKKTFKNIIKILKKENS